MELVVLVVIIALFQYCWFAAQVGRGRLRYGVRAPASSGHPVFERLYRIQMNTQEQLMLFLPAMFMFPLLGEPAGWPAAEIAAAAGVVWIIGRAVYARTYVQDPERRALGFMLTFLPSALLLLGSLVLVVLAAV